MIMVKLTQTSATIVMHDRQLNTTKAQTTKQIYGAIHITAMQGTVYGYDAANYILSVMYYAFIWS